MAGGKLAVYVHVHGPDGSRAFGPDDEVPAEWAKLINNPAVWAEAPESEEEPNEAPPRSGAGSGLEAWRAYAESLGIEIGEDATRDEIIAAVDAAAK
jgi:hypothetical protein